ncbi:hypothetical protein [Streptomyces fuscigenes]|uniref:hypothetical protein n=1 Tax=Streptomyces fuscigenes TaxID=1528880 RepID=UPI001F3F3EA1|nr:hypothetical protein [Streptomyces fuscigenes]MCF3961245.1 hypothetical protein [Streptomyces fuscigenes]
MDTISKQYEKQTGRYAPRHGELRHGRPPAGGVHGGAGRRERPHRAARQRGRYENEYEQQYPVQDDDHGNDYGGGASWES